MITTVGCKKIKESVEEKAVLNFITSGQWKVASLIKENSDLTSEFNPYKFQFKTNKKVDAIKNGMVEKTGDWNGDANTLTITSNFPNATMPLVLLNGVWKITDGGETFVVATQAVDTQTATLRLEKI
jgi:hypothetical protein